MKICITGGAGMIGSNLVEKLVRDNHSVIVIDNLWRGSLDNLKINQSFIIPIDKQFFNLNISDPNNLNKIKSIIKDVDIVIHLADIVAGINYVFKNQYEIFKLNNSINSNLFNATINSNISKLIYVGTACSFPLHLQKGLESELKEEDLFPANPESAYGWSKLIGQLELRYLSELVPFEINTLIFHNVYGPKCEYEGERTQVIPALINKIIESRDNETITVWGSGNQGRAFIYVDDVVDAIIKTINKEKLPEYIQIGPRTCTSIKELVTTLINISGKKLNVFFDKTKPEGDKGRYANYQIAKETLGWSPEVNLYDGLTKTYNWINNRKQKNRLLSIIIPNYNDIRIERTIKSILEQSYSNYEIIVVEGCIQNNSTRDIYNQYNDRICLIHEPDQGIFDALNKGVQKATGELVFLIGSDDVLSDKECFSSVMEKYNENRTVDGICIGCRFITKGRKIIRQWKVNTISSTKIKWGIMPPHFSLFLKKDIYKEIGYFDFEEDWIASDTEWILRLASLREIKIPVISNHFVDMEYGGESTGSISNILKAIRINSKSARKHKIRQWPLTPYIKVFSKLLQIKLIDNKIN